MGSSGSVKTKITIFDDFGGSSERKQYSLLGFISELFGTRVLIDFRRTLWEAVCVILDATWLQNGRHLGVILGAISCDPGFPIFDYPYNEKHTFLRFDGTLKSIKF